LWHTDVTDVPTLGTCHILDISSTNVTDVPTLGYCHTLDII